MDTRPKELGDYLEICLRRKWQILIPAAIFTAASAYIVMSMPSVYKSVATILIEEQEIPAELVKSTVTSYADQRIQVISQQVMTRANLWQIIKDFNLFEKARQQNSSDALIERLRKNIKLDMISADIVDRRSGQKTPATIAFSVAYFGESPEQAQRVASQLTTLYLNENMKNRSQKASDTSNFLEDEAKKLNDQIADLESRLATFKQKNVGRLPELSQLNLQLRDRAEADYTEVERQLAQVNERKFYLEGQLAQIKPNTPIMSVTGERILDTDERLKALRSQYVTAASSYSPEHPDVIKMRNEIDALEQSGASGDRAEESKRLTKLRADLASVQERYTQDHPDVIRLKTMVAQAEASLSRAPAPESQPVRKPENPAYITMQSQLEATNSELRTLKIKQGQIKARMGDYESRLQQAPQVEREYLDMTRDRENATKRYQEIKAKLSEAQVAQELEKDRKGERFSLIDPPQAPERADRPNRPLLMLIGLLFSLASGVAYGGVLEALDKAIRGSNNLSNLLPVPVLASVPYIPNRSDISNAGLTYLMNGFLALVGISTVLLALHILWMPLDVAWFVLLRKVGL
jgi:polysaccharide biosynthesis transport protein